MTTTHQATGRFDVTMQPQPDAAPGALLGRMLLDKRYHGTLDASGQGQMLSALTATTGSAGYVAIEQVTGTLDGRNGSFVLQHHGVMNRGVKELAISVVPDSGTGELAGLAGRMDIRVTDGQHFYVFDYTLG
jgi:hypothetical protein